MQPGNHIDDELLSTYADDQLSAAEVQPVRAHLASCSTCHERLDGFREVADLLRRLPEQELPRDFSPGPHLLVDPPNVVRLRRWYTVTRIAAGSLAAVFVLLSAGTLYVDLRPGGSSSAAEPKPQVLSAPAPAPTSVAQPAVAVRAAAPAASPAAAVAPASGAAAPRPAAAPQADDQVAAATSVRELPTLVPTPVPTAAPVAAIVPVIAPVLPDPAAPLRAAAALVGILAALALLATFVVRHRLLHLPTHF